MPTRVYKQLITKNPHDAKVWYNLAETHFSGEKIKEALHCFERLAHSPDIAPNLFVRIATCYEKLGNPSKSKTNS